MRHLPVEGVLAQAADQNGDVAIDAHGRPQSLSASPTNAAAPEMGASFRYSTKALEAPGRMLARLDRFSYRHGHPQVLDFPHDADSCCIGGPGSDSKCFRTGSVWPAVGSSDTVH